MGQTHLLPHLGDRNGVEPFVRAWIANIVEVVINSGAAASFAFFLSWKPSNIAPIIVAPQQSYVIRDAHPFLIVFLHFFVERPVLGYGGKIGAHLAGNYLALVGHDLFQQSDVGALGHREIAVSPHAETYDALVILVAQNAFGPELLQDLGVRGIVPGPDAMPFPFLLGPQH